MKVNYLPRNKTKSVYIKWIIIFVAVFVLGAVSFYFLDGVIISTVSPIWRAENAVSRSLRNVTTYFSSQNSLVRDNAALKDRIASLEIEVTSLSSGQVVVNNLLELLNRRPESNMIVAAVLTYPPETPYDIIIIDAGLDQSVTVGSEVLLPEGPILGVVSDVLPRKARVKLLSTNGEKTNAILERNNVPVTLVGAGEGNFKLVLPRDIEVERGDRIISPHLNARLIALVGGVDINSTDSFKEVLAKSPTNIFTLRFVFIKP